MDSRICSKKPMGEEGSDECAQALQNSKNEAANKEQGQDEADEIEYDEQNGALPDWDYLNAHFSRNVLNDLESEAQDVPEFVAKEIIVASSLADVSETPEGPQKADRDFEIFGILPRLIVLVLRIKVEVVQDIDHEIEAPDPPEHIIYELQDRLLKFQNTIPMRCQAQELLRQLIFPYAAKWVASRCLEEFELMFETKAAQFFEELNSLITHKNQEIQWLE
ncbi:Protein CBG14698 [Caenorhabditis briggsae]|uniref:Protein CBG14698 n=1 Tax=Caenorhabditis briggsae TaxID=6238 RepID=A8XKH3_CAEBR|nr:Protein CBG14698 [Caenorhabditis briggsae]CAP33147.1 Protein CBG14698 [Caenorhabditis briggsae]